MVIDATDEPVKAMIWSHAVAASARASMDAGAFGHHTALVTMLAHDDLHHPSTGLEGSDRAVSITEHLTHYADLAARAADAGKVRFGARHRRRADTSAQRLAPGALDDLTCLLLEPGPWTSGSGDPGDAPSPRPPAPGRADQ